MKLSTKDNLKINTITAIKWERYCKYGIFKKYRSKQ